MGLFGWHKCGELGCDATLFVPMFDAKEHGAPEDGALWRAYLAERPTWHAVDARDQSAVRCPAHAPPAHAPPAKGDGDG